MAKKDLGDEFKKLHQLGTYLYSMSRGDKPIPFDELVDIDTIIKACAKIAKTKAEKSIVVRAQAFWDGCFRKFYNHISNNGIAAEVNPAEAETHRTAKHIGRFRVAKKFSVLHYVIEGLKNETKIGDKSGTDFDEIMKLIEDCKSLAKTNAEKGMVRRALTVYEKRLCEWQEIQQNKDSHPARRPEDEFDSNLNEEDKKLLAKHQRIVNDRRGNK